MRHGPSGPEWPRCEPCLGARHEHSGREKSMVANHKIFDSHLHIIDDRYPLIANNGYLPEAFTCEDYLHRMQGYELAGGAVVSGSFQGFDTTYLVAALQRLGPSFVGVAQVPAAITDDEIGVLDKAGVRGIRFNLKRGGSEGVRYLDALARRVHEVAGWHVELYVDAKDLPALVPVLSALPAVGIDHLGLTRAGFGALLKLIEKGCRVKVTGFARVDFDVRKAIRDLISANPEAPMFGTDLPSTRAPRPYQDEDFELVADLLESGDAERVFYGNARRFYRLPDSAGDAL